MLLDGPAVLSRNELESIDQDTSAGTLRAGLDAAMAANEMLKLPLEALTTQLSAMFDRAALAVADGADATDQQQVIEAIITSLSGGSSGSAR